MDGEGMWCNKPSRQTDKVELLHPVCLWSVEGWQNVGTVKQKTGSWFIEKEDAKVTVAAGGEHGEEAGSSLHHCCF